MENHRVPVKRSCWRVVGPIWMAGLAVALCTAPAQAAKRAKQQGGGGNPNDSWNKMDYGPFLSATVVAAQPADKTTPKGVVGKLAPGEKKQSPPGGQAPE